MYLPRLGDCAEKKVPWAHVERGTYGWRYPRGQDCGSHGRGERECHGSGINENVEWRHSVYQQGHWCGNIDIFGGSIMEIEAVI